MPFLLNVKNLVKEYAGSRFRGARSSVKALDDVSFTLTAGARMAIIGGSGSGKTTLASCIACLERPTSGTIEFAGRNVGAMAESELRAVRPQVQLVFQDPALALNPRFSVLEVVTEPLLIQKRIGLRERTERGAELLRAVGLSSELLRRTATELSGGQRQRLAIARALGLKPKLLIFDEALSSLDCSVQSQIANLLLELSNSASDDGGKPAMIFITHDLVMAARLADEILVMDRGRIVEAGSRRRIVSAPEHAATRALLAATPGVRPDSIGTARI